jgi:hypothetical protein
VHSNAFAEQTKGLEPLQVRHERLQNRRLQTRSLAQQSCAAACLQNLRFCTQIFDLQSERSSEHKSEAFVRKGFVRKSKICKRTAVRTKPAVL